MMFSRLFKEHSNISGNARRAVLLPLFFCVVAMLPFFRHTLEWMDLKLVDLFFAVSPYIRTITGKAPMPEHPVAIVTKDQTFFQRFQRDPDRSDMAELTGLLKKNGVRVLAFDFLFSDASDQAKDQKFASAIASFPMPILATHFVGRGQQSFEKFETVDRHADRPPWPIPVFQPFRKSAAANALINLPSDLDSIVRMAPLAFYPEESEDFFPSLGYSVWIADMIMEHEKTIASLALALPSASTADSLAKILAMGPFRFSSTGHAGLDKMSRRLELVFIARIMHAAAPHRFPDISETAQKYAATGIPATTWLAMPSEPLPIIGSYNTPCLRLPFTKHAPPLKGDGLPSTPMGTILKTEADKTSSLLLSHLYTGFAASTTTSIRLSTHVTASGSGSICGKVDQFKKPVKATEILLLMPESGYWHITTTNADGNFAFQNLPGGEFVIQTSHGNRNDWVKGLIRGHLDASTALSLPDLHVPMTRTGLEVKLPATAPAIVQAVFFGEPVALMQSDESGRVVIPAECRDVVSIDEGTDLVCSSSSLLFPDGSPAGKKIVAVLPDNGEWVLRFFCRHQFSANGSFLVRSIPTSLDARMALFSPDASNSGQKDADIQLFPATNTVVADQSPTNLSDSLAEVCFTAPAGENIKVLLISETGERETAGIGQSVLVKPGRYMILCETDTRKSIHHAAGLNTPVVFAGSSLPQDQDFIVTPVNFMDRSFTRIPGVHLHAHLFSALKRQSWLRAMPAHSDRNPDYWPIWQTVTVLPLILALNVVFSAYGAAIGGMAVIACSLLWLSAGIILFLNQLLLPIFFPMVQLAGFGVFRGYLAWAISRRKELETRQTFGRFISSAVVEEILRTPDSLRPGGEKKELSVIFTDLAG
jgi:CHASE2 domain-containing sensor protein